MCLQKPVPAHALHVSEKSTAKLWEVLGVSWQEKQALDC
jgi:hypothetical protein